MGQKHTENWPIRYGRRPSDRHRRGWILEAAPSDRQQETAVTMDRQLIVFGTEMRRRRLAAGHSLSTLSALVHYSRSHLSKVETGAKPPSADLARRCDAAL